MQTLALIPLKDAAQRLGFSVESKHWRAAFHRFLKRSRLPVVKLSARRFRISPEVIDAYVQRRTVGRLPKPLPFQSTIPDREAA